MTSRLQSADAVFEVNLGAIQTNYRTMRKLVGASITLAGVVKSDAYGLGMNQVGETLAEAGCRFFFVANLNEGVRLRAALPDVSIAVLQDDYIRYERVYHAENLIPVLNTEAEVLFFCGRHRLLPYIMNVDTGFSRFGLQFEQVRRLYLAGLFSIRCPQTIISHLACSENAADDTNTLQRNRFVSICALLRPAGRSLAASAGVWLGAPYHFDMVRVGSALYGLNNANVRPNPLKSVVRLASRLVDIRDVPRREAVGYGATFRTTRTTRIGVAGIGYTQGLPWSCANKISVRIGDFIAPVIGRISMEYITIDLTDIPESICNTHSWVEILNESFGVDDLAGVAGVNAQEIITRLGSACRRAVVPSGREETGAVTIPHQRHEGFVHLM